MPINKYFRGHGEEVARSMKKKHPKTWKNFFYGRANKMGETASPARNKKLNKMHNIRLDNL